MIFPLPPTPLLNPKARLLCDLQSQYMDTIWDARIWQSIILPDGRPPPFYIGALSCMDRGTSSTSIQLASGHTFTADYSGLFWKGADDNTLCPCNFTNEVQDLDPASPVPSFDDLMQQHLAPATPSPTPPPSPRAQLPHPQRQQPRPRCLFRNITAHVLFQCPLYDVPCRRIFRLHAQDAYVFGTEEGGRKLGAFLQATNRLLRPLPPRPDPP